MKLVIRATRELETMPFDAVFYIDDQRGEQLCHATGREVLFEGDDGWWNEYVDCNGEFQYARD